MHLSKFREKKLHVLFGCLAFILLFCSSCYDISESSRHSQDSLPDQSSAIPQEESTSALPTSKISVHFLDVGQADSILLLSENGQAMLIDAGNNADGAGIVQYLRDLDITELSYVIGTHPHEDHIGGLDDVISWFGVKTIMMPKVSTTTQTFEDVLDVIASKDLSVTAPSVGDTFEFSEGILQVVSIGEDEDDLNNSSLVLRYTYGDISFLFTGDAESAAEEKMLTSGLELKSTFLKVAHHGSDTSSTAAFINAVSPKVSIVSVGKDNAYGHPSKSVLDMLSATSIMYRTDESGTIVVTTNGKNYEIRKVRNNTIGIPHDSSQPTEQSTPIESSSYDTTQESSQEAPQETPQESSQEEPQEITVYVTKTGEKYHRSGCRYLKKSKIAISLEDAKRSYEPCSVCKPPQ